MFWTSERALKYALAVLTPDLSSIQQSFAGLGCSFLMQSLLHILLGNGTKPSSTDCKKCLPQGPPILHLHHFRFVV